MNRAPRYLGLDLGTCTGWAVAEGDRLIGSGVCDFSIKRNQHIGHRGLMFLKWLLTFGIIDEIYYEKIQFVPKGRSMDGGELYKGLLMLLNMYSAEYSVPNFGVWPGTLKSQFAGHGHAEKTDMCATARATGWKGGQINTAQYHDEVDAIALLVTQLREKYGIRLQF